VDDPLQVIFNDRSVIQLMVAYGTSLRAVVRQANGAHPAQKPLLREEVLQSLPASILTPYEEALRRLMEEGDLTGCVKIPESESHWLFRVPVPLERSTAYTLDVEPTDQPPFSSDVKDSPRAPLFRVPFTTSRFRSAAELGEVMRAARVQHRVLKKAIGSLPNAASENELEDALVDAGLEALPATGEPAVTLLWQPAGAGFVLAGVLVDAPEPLWRFRPEAVLVTESGEGGPVKHFAELPRLWLEMVATTPSLRQVIRSSGGARGLVLLNPGADSLTLSLKQHEHPLIDATKSTQTPLFSAPLPTIPPWSTENV
jgi:hypothetical protein